MKGEPMSSTGTPPGEQSTLIPVSEDPLCREASLTSLDTLITPEERFYVRNHFSQVPRQDAATWRLEVDGQVRRSLSLSFDDILAMPSQEAVITLECAGNSRAYLTPPAEGLTFSHGAVSTARWRGVPLAHVLERAGLEDSVREVVFQGADSGHEEEEGVSLEVPYGRSLSREVALGPGPLLDPLLAPLLAYEMNGRPLIPGHGYPLRLVVPGWYGMASVKWLVRISGSERPFNGFFQARRYVFITEGVEESPARPPVTTMKVKSLITHPRHGEVVPKGTYTIRGMAWSGEGKVERVEVSTQGGRGWQEARLVGEDLPGVWRQWEMPWDASRPGHFICMARATDSAGNTQPASIPWNFRGYANNSIHTIAVEVPGS